MAELELKTGDYAPDFTAKTGEGATVTLSALCESSRVVLVFYPGDDTPVCTRQLCALRDSMTELGSADCTVLGINPASDAKHKKFGEKHSFPFPLVVDSGSEIAKAYGCKGFLGIITRTVFVVGTNRKLLYAKRGNPPVSEILSVLE